MSFSRLTINLANQRAGVWKNEPDDYATPPSLPFNGGRGSCVDDTYRTSVTTYRELACLVAGRSASTVIVAAAPRARWSAERADLVGALDAYAVR